MSGANANAPLLRTQMPNFFRLARVRETSKIRIW